MAAVTAKVQLAQKNISGIGTAALTFSPDYADGRNKEWADATPNLQFQMTVKAEVAEFFTPGGRYTVTFEPDEPEPAEHMPAV